MQTKKLIEDNLRLGKELVNAARKRRDEALQKWEAAPQGSQQKRRAYDKLVDEEKEVIRAETAAGMLEWVLSEPIGWRYFFFYTRETYHQGPFSSNYCGYLIFLENTPEVQSLIDAGYVFTRTAAEEYPVNANNNTVDTIADFEQIVAKTTNYRLSMHRPDLTN